MRIKDGTEYISTCGLVVEIAAYKTWKKLIVSGLASKRRAAEANFLITPKPESLDNSFEQFSLNDDSEQLFYCHSCGKKKISRRKRR
jgi:hypothetical protein